MDTHEIRICVDWCHLDARYHYLRMDYYLNIFPRYRNDIVEIELPTLNEKEILTTLKNSQEENENLVPENTSSTTTTTNTTTTTTQIEVHF